LLAGIKRRADFLGFVRFRNRDELDLLDCPAALFRRLRNLSSNSVEIFRDCPHN